MPVSANTITISSSECHMPSFRVSTCTLLVSCVQHTASDTVEPLRAAPFTICSQFHTCAHRPVAQDPDPLADANFGSKFSDDAKDPETLVGCRLVA